MKPLQLEKKVDKSAITLHVLALVQFGLENVFVKKKNSFFLRKIISRQSKKHIVSFLESSMATCFR